MHSQILPIRIVLTALLLLVLVAPAPRLPAQIVSCDPQEGPPLDARFQSIGGVSLGTGAFQMDEIDIRQGRGRAGILQRTYLSLDTRPTLLGVGWMTNFQARLSYAGSGLIQFTMPGGAVEQFKDPGVGGQSRGTGRGYRVLTEEPNGRWVVADDGTTWTFDSGRLVRVDSPDGDWVEVRYDPDNIATTVGPDGPGLRFTMGPGTRLMHVAGASDRNVFVDYAYDAVGRLIRVGSSVGLIRQFTYDGASQRITTISDGDGHVLLALDYDPMGWVIRDRDALGLIDGEGVTFVYDRRSDRSVRAALTYPPSLTDPDWHPRKIAELDPDARLVELEVQPTWARRYVGHYAYDPANRRIPLDNPCPAPHLDGPRPDPLIAQAG